jgi:hypothetical protein
LQLAYLGLAAAFRGKMKVSLPNFVDESDDSVAANAFDMQLQPTFGGEGPLGFFRGGFQVLPSQRS